MQHTGVEGRLKSGKPSVLGDLAGVLSVGLGLASVGEGVSGSDLRARLVGGVRAPSATHTSSLTGLAMHTSNLHAREVRLNIPLVLSRPPRAVDHFRSPALRIHSLNATAAPCSGWPVQLTLRVVVRTCEGLPGRTVTHQWLC